APAAAAPPRANVGAEIRAHVADLWPTDAPSEPAASPPATEAGRDGDAAPTRAATPKEKQAAGPPPAAPAVDPAAVTRRAAAQLHGAKRQAANELMGAAMTPLHRESAALGIDEAGLVAIIEEVKASDPQWRRFSDKFARARSLEDARDAAESGYLVLGDRVM